MPIDHQLKSLRIAVRQNSSAIVNHVAQTNISLSGNKQKGKKKELCSFCSTDKEITKEHVLPRWTYEGCTTKFFITNVNGLSQTYNKTTVPACSTCNNEKLSSLEVYIKNLFSKINLDSGYFNREEMTNIIRWLEILDYKFQVLNARRKFITSKEKGFIPYLADFPLTVLRPNVESPSKAITEIRRSLKRLAVKSKDNGLNSLVVFKTTNKGFHFFHAMDDFIFLELPKYKLAIFYFYKRTFPTIKKAHAAAKKVIEKAY
jgi:hypothetical protein